VFDGKSVRRRQMMVSIMCMWGCIMGSIFMK
jgi:hypothetical protein